MTVYIGVVFELNASTRAPFLHSPTAGEMRGSSGDVPLLTSCARCTDAVSDA